jgi:hypothetical protein
MTHKETKNQIRRFMQNYYTDERLSQLLAHAQDGKLAYVSCCCFIGIPTATHELRGQHYMGDVEERSHYDLMAAIPEAQAAERAFLELARGHHDVERRRILIPMIRAEMKRRSHAPSEKAAELATV